MHRNRFANIRKAIAPPDAAAPAIAQSEDGNLLARVIGTAPGRIAAVVRRNHEEVVIVEPLTKFGQPAVELLKRERVPSGVAPVAVNRVEVDKIGEQQTTILQAAG